MLFIILLLSQIRYRSIAQDNDNSITKMIIILIIWLKNKMRLRDDIFFGSILPYYGYYNQSVDICWQLCRQYWRNQLFLERSCVHRYRVISLGSRRRTQFDYTMEFHYIKIPKFIDHTNVIAIEVDVQFYWYYLRISTNLNDNGQYWPKTRGMRVNDVVVNDQILIRPMMYLALSYDHRIIDGKEAVTFLIKVKDALEDPSRLLLNL